MIAVNIPMPTSCAVCPFSMPRSAICRLSTRHIGGWHAKRDPDCPLRPVERLRVARIIPSTDPAGIEGYADYVKQRLPYEIADKMCAELIKSNAVHFTSEREDELRERLTAELLVVMPEDPKVQIDLDYLK